LIAFFQASTGKVDVFSSNAGRYLVNTNPQLREFLLVDADLDFVLEAAADFDGGRTFFGLEVCFNSVLGQAA